METKEFNKVSSEHSGISSGAKFITTKFHHEVQGDLEEGTMLVLEKIAHYPTRYLLKDENEKVWTLPIHSVKEATEEVQDEPASEKVDSQVEADEATEEGAVEVESTEEVQDDPVSKEIDNNESEGLSEDEKITNN